MSDPYFSNVQLLLHFDGTNGATTTVDSSSFARTIPFTGNTLSNTVAKFGATSASIPTNGSVDINSVAALIPSGDFTLEFFIYIPSISSITGFPAPSASVIVSFNEYDGHSGVAATQLQIDKTGTLCLVTGSNYAGFSKIATASGVLTSGAWNYIVLQRSGTTSSIYLNGGSPVTTTSALVLGTNSNSGLGISYGFAFGIQTVPAYFDELRLTVGTARYSGSITTPTAAFPPPLVVPITSSPITITPGTVNLAIGNATIASLSGAGQTIAITPGTVGFAPSPVVTLSGFPIAVTPGTVGRGYSVATLSAIVSAAGTIPTIAVATAPLAGAGITVSPGGVGAITPTNVSVPLTSGTGITVNKGTPVAVNLTELLATISGALPAITGSIYISVTAAKYFTVSGALPVLSGNIYASTNSTTFVISGAIPAITSRWGYISGALPPFIAILETQAVFNGQVTYAMNIKTGETTQYANYNFLSVIRIGFNYYGVRSDGVYLLGGAYDITAPIPTSFTTAQSTLGSTSIKYVPFLYLDAQNPCMVTQITDNETAGPFYSHPTGLKTKLSRGIKGKIWQFKVNNVQGNQFRIGALEALSEITSHRVK